MFHKTQQDKSKKIFFWIIIHDLDRNGTQYLAVRLMKSPTEFTDIILCVENLNPGSRSVSQESDTRDKVWLKANKMKLEKTVLGKEKSLLENIKLSVVVIFMLLVALSIVFLRSSKFLLSPFYFSSLFLPLLISSTISTDVQ